MFAARINKINYSTLCVIGMYLRDITNTTFFSPILRLNMSRLTVLLTLALALTFFFNYFCFSACSVIILVIVIMLSNVIVASIAGGDCGGCSSEENVGHDAATRVCLQRFGATGGYVCPLSPKQSELRLYGNKRSSLLTFLVISIY